jgi:TolB-like protein/Flp pilus assembly protein TadD
LAYWRQTPSDITMPASAQNSSTGAVFLSYAREDIDAARRIADALRSHGVEVWFDENELRGGDAWDQKIRRQIDACTLFLPIISRHTEARGKGYFRLEWKLAVDQTHLLVQGTPFLIPVVVDETPESIPGVPVEFRSVQWTRLPGALPTPQFVEQVKRLLSAPQGPAPAANPMPAAGRPAPAPAPRAIASKHAFPPWIWTVVAVAIAATAAGYFMARKTAPASPPPQVPAESPAAAAPAAEGKSVAVLPFANFSTDADNEFFAEGLQDEVITALAKIHDLKVISRTSVMAYKNPEGRNLKKIAADLGVASILEGSVQRAGGKMHLNVQLIDARTDEHLWAESYTSDLTDIFTLEATLAQEIAGALKANLTPNETALIGRRPTENQAAYDLYLRAGVLTDNLSNSSTKDDLERVISLYEQAEAMDPLFPLPHMQASVLHGTMYWFGQMDPTPGRKAKAQAELDAMRRLAPGAPETRFTQGAFDYLCRNDWSGALKEFLGAEADLPSDAELQFRIGTCYRRLGRMQEALKRFERAVELNPNDEFSVTTLIQSAYFMRRFSQVIELVDRFNPGHSLSFDSENYAISAKFELGGDRAAFLREEEELPHSADDPYGLLADYGKAWREGDLAAATRVVADPRLDWLGGYSGTIQDPVSLHRSFLALLGGNKDEARRQAALAIAVYQNHKWEPRQEEWVRMGIATAEVCSGRTDEGLRDAKAALDAQSSRDKFEGNNMLYIYASLHALANRREEAFALLRQVLALPSSEAPNDIRYDLIWSRLKDDPRFEQILRSAKPL